MRLHFFPDYPVQSVLAILYTLTPTFLTLGVGLSLALWAKRRVARASKSNREVAIDAAGLVTEILEAGRTSSRLTLTTSGPLPTFYDPSRKELRLARNLAQSRTLNALGIASHEAGHALQDAQGYRLSKARPPWIFAAKLGCGVAWLTLLAGSLMLSPPLLIRGAALYSAAVLSLLPLQLVETDANRRVRSILSQIEEREKNSLIEDLAFLQTLEASKWVDIAGTLPRLWPYRIHR